VVILQGAGTLHNVTPVDDIKNISPPWFMEWIQEDQPGAEATGGFLAVSAKRSRSTVSEIVITFTAGNFMNISISIKATILSVSRCIPQKEMSAVIRKRPQHF
jgi:hypothetical protein